ncbi:MAG: hypothetical protein WBA73_01555 [Devosia sp.]
MNMRDQMYRRAFAALFVVQPTLALTQEFTSPMDVMGTFYGAYITGGVGDLAPYFSDRLTKEMAGARLSPEIIASMGIDPLVGASNPQVTQLMFSPTEPGEGRRATVEVTFHNRREPVELTFELIEEAKHGWQIDHFEGTSGSVNWCSRTLVEAMNQPSAE